MIERQLPALIIISN